MRAVDAVRALAPPAVLERWAAARTRQQVAATRSVVRRAPLASSLAGQLRLVKDDRRGAAACGSTAVLAHYDPGGEARPYVLHHLARLRDEGFGLVVVSNGDLDGDAAGALADAADVVACRPNRGYDFGAWQAGLNLLRTAPLERLLLVNDSVYGPLRPLGPHLRRATPEAADVWGMTEASTDGRELHLQSYWVLAHAPALRHEGWDRFWSRLRLVDDKRAVVLTHEVGLSSVLRSAGLRLRALLPTSDLRPALARQREQALPGLTGRLERRAVEAALAGRRPLNATHQLWRELVVEHEFPYVKRELLVSNPSRRPGVDRWRAVLDPDVALGWAIAEDLRRRAEPRPVPHVT